MPSSLGRWGGEIWILFNVGKGTKKYFSNQIWSNQGASREQVGIN